MVIVRGIPQQQEDENTQDREEEEEEGEEVATNDNETYMVGFVIVNIVGLQYYRGTISGREMVGLVREPLNQYDSNAIKVLNTRSIQVGHIDRNSASVLAPLLDSNLIIVEGIVPKASVAKNRYKIPCQVHIFARIEAFPIVQSRVSGGGLILISENNMAFGLSGAEVVKEKKVPQGKSVDEIFKLLDEYVSKKGVLEAIEPPKHVVKSELFPHQKEGLGWLVHRERSCELPPFWEEKDGTFVNILTNYESDIRPEPIRGGIFADDMGLGKTLTLLSLIALDKYEASISSSAGTNTFGNDKLLDQDYEVSLVGKKSKRGRATKTAGISRKKQKAEVKVKKRSVHDYTAKSSDALDSRSTLIVCPPSVFSAWVTQLADHTIQGTLKLYLYYGERTEVAEELLKYDIVLTTYSTLVSEDSWSESPVRKIEWWRIILDEAHVIKNSNARQSKVVSNLNSKRRWAVTGTPIQNNSLDLFSLMTFLKFEPLSIKYYWNTLVQRPLALGEEQGIVRLQVLMATISLRRTKDRDLVGLPSKSLETVLVDLYEEQREIYDKVEGDVQSIIRHYISNDSLTSNYSRVLTMLVRLRQICSHLELCPSDFKELLQSSNIEDVNDPKLLEKLLSVIEDDEDFDCPICISSPSDIVITCCAHIFCRSCILKSLKLKGSCPLCRHALSESDLFRSPPKPADMVNSDDSSSNASSKVTALLKLLSASRDESPSRKSVVFSQFRKMLLLLEKPLERAGFRVLRLDGSMNAKRRAQVVSEFATPSPDAPTVLLASLRAAGTGINLTAASRVYLMEPWWNPAVEEQAMDRVHRIGQKEDVKIVRLIARNTIDERILGLQDKKKLLARNAFGKRGSQDSRGISLDDLRTLMSL